MRLTEGEIAPIKEGARTAFGDGVVVRLFGSRVDDHARGGDIDLHLKVDAGQQDAEHAARFRWRLFDMIEPRKVDLVFQTRERSLRPIDLVAYDEGIVL